MIGTRKQQVKAKPVAGDRRPTDSNGEIVVCEVDVLDKSTITNYEAALKWLTEQYTAQDIVLNFIRQDTQDRANVARADYKNGGDRQAKEQKVAELTQRLLAGDASAGAELAALVLKRR